MKVIQGIKKNRKPTVQMYGRVLVEVTEKYSDEALKGDRDGIRKFVFVAVRYIKFAGSQIDQMEYTEVQSLFDLINVTTDFMGCMTPVELIQTFPITKQYDGKQYEMKDYFTTTEALKEYQPDQLIGERIMELLWDYHNMDIRLFEVYKMSCMSRMRRLQGEKGLLEQFFEDQGTPLTTYTRQDDYLINNDTGEVMPISKPKKRRPKYLSVVGGD